jgi:putative serine/threonine protein kinase
MRRRKVKKVKQYFEKTKISRRDLKPYTLIGAGRDGAVYKLEDNVCVKYFFDKNTQQKELEAIKLGQTSNVIPRLYEHGENYIVMEYVNGISLSRYLKDKGELTEELTKKILSMFSELKEIGFKRLDTEVRHILINEAGELKVIDHKRAFILDKEVPDKLLSGLKELGVTHVFLNHVKTLDPSIHDAWTKHL